MVGVDDQDDPRLERDVRAGEPVGVAAAVPVLVAVADDLAHVGEARDRCQDPLAELGMLLHDPVLLRRERPLLREYVRGDADLPDVVHQRAELEALESRRVELELFADGEGEIGDRPGMRRRLLVARLQGVR